MKKPSKIILSSLIALVGFSVATSVTSTIAWFQYATRATVAYTGTSAHCSKLLNIAINNDSVIDKDNLNWGTNIRSADLPSAKFAPITTGEMDKDSPLPTQTVGTETKARFYASPDYRQGPYQDWLIAGDDNYLQFEVLIRLADVDQNYGTPNQKYLANDVYLTNLTIQSASVGNDLDKSVRVHFASTYYDSGVEQHKYFLFASEATETAVGGLLDVNDDGKLDTDGYPGMTGGDELCIYGGSDGDAVISDTLNGKKLENPLLQTSYASDDATLIAEDNNGVLTTTGVTPLGSTSATKDQYMKIVVTVWLEGWSELHRGSDDNYQDEDSSIWNSASYAAQKFNVGMTFGVQIHGDNEQSSFKRRFKL